MKQLRTEPEFKPMGYIHEPWGRCSCCKRKMGDFRVKVTWSYSNAVAYICLGCAEGLRNEDQGFNP